MLCELLDFRYFTVTMLNICTIYYDSHEVIPFPGTTMDRNLLKVEVGFAVKMLTLLEPSTLNYFVIGKGAHGSNKTETIKFTFGKYWRLC